VIDALAVGLASAGEDVTLVATGDSSCPVRRRWVHEQALGTDRVDIVDEILHIDAAYAALAGCDVVHDHTLIGPLWGARRRLRICTTNHGPFDDRLVGLYREICDDVDVVAISYDQARSAVGVRIAAVIPHGLDLSRFEVGDGSGGYLAFLGRMHPTKGVVNAIRVARAAGIPLRIAAKMREPDEHAFFRAEVEPLLGGEVEYIGEIAADDKAAFLGAAMGLLNPIEWAEPFGLVMAEALASGTPVVATPAGAAPEIVEHGVTGFVAHGVANLAAAVCRLGELDRGACRRAADERFSAERMVRDHLALYGRSLQRAA
jgi:glycosyltransferase involved in cell wall biosynthesis